MTIRTKLLLLGMCLLTFSKIQAQIQCEDIGPNTATYTLSIERMMQNPPQNIIFTIPLWVTYIVKNNDIGIESITPLKLVNDLNGVFTNGMQFSLCGVTIIKDDNWFVMQQGQFIPILKATQGINPNPEDNRGYVDVVIVGGFGSGILGSNVPPMPGVMPSLGGHGGVVSINNSMGVAHELGHYFGLRHTHIYNKTSTDPNHPEWAQYVHDYLDPESHPITIGVNTYTCHQTGDLLCDTPADPGHQLPNGTIICNEDNCQTVTCDPAYQQDLLGLTYHPDPTFIMGYYNCQSRFSPKQGELMYSNLTDPSNALGYLIDPATTPIYCKYDWPTDIGYVQRDCKYFNSGNPGLGLSPMKRNSILLLDGIGQTCGLTPNQTDAKGQYNLYSCIYLNQPGHFTSIPDKNYVPNFAWTINDGKRNGLEMSDVDQINKHIIGLELLDSPFQMIASDANNSGSVTFYDALTIKHVILDPEHFNLPAGSWRYVPDICLQTPSFYDAFYDPNWITSLGHQINPFDAVWIDPDGINRIYSQGSGTPIVPNISSWMDHINLNTTSVAAQKPSSWSFWGVKVGDVNCSAVMAPEAPPHSSDHSFAIPNIVAIQANQEFTLKINLSISSNISSWQMGLLFNTDALQVLGVQPGTTDDYSPDDISLNNINHGIIRAGWFDINGSAKNLNGKVLFEVRVKSLQTIPDISQVFQLKGDILPLAFYNAVGEEISNPSLTLIVENEHLNMYSGSNVQNKYSENSCIVFPNPSSGVVGFKINVKENVAIKINIYNELGRLTLSHEDICLKGLNRIEINDLGQLASGLYYYDAQVGSDHFSGKVLLK